MIVKDLLGNQIDEGSLVNLALGPALFALGKIEHLSTGLDGLPPVAVVNTSVNIPILPNGTVNGVIAVRVDKKDEPLVKE